MSSALAPMVTDGIEETVESWANHRGGSGCKGLVAIEAVRPGSGTDG